MIAIVLAFVAALAGVQGTQDLGLSAPVENRVAMQKPEPGQADTPAIQRSPEEWQRREAELLDRIHRLEAELSSEQELRMAREREWHQFTLLVGMLPEERRPELPEFMRPKEGDSDSESVDLKPVEPDPAEQEALNRAQEIKATLRTYLQAEGQTSLDILEVGVLQNGAIGPIVARQLDGRGRFLSTLVADRLRLEKSRTGFVLTLVLERGYERRAGRIWPFPDSSNPGRAPVAAPSEMAEAADAAGIVRTGELRIPLTGVNPSLWIRALPELFAPEDRQRMVHDGSVNLVSLRYNFNTWMEARPQGPKWRLVSIGGVVGSEWRDVHLAETDLEDRIVRRLFADRARIRLEGTNLIFELQAGAQERSGVRTAFLAGHYTLTLPGIDPEKLRRLALPGL